jgi:hypothetical protein
MPESVGTTVDMLLDLDRDTIVGALVLAVLIAAMTAGAYLWLRRGKRDVSALLVSLLAIANLVCLVTGAGFIQSRSRLRRIVVVPSASATDRPGAFVEARRRSGRESGLWRRTNGVRRGQADGFPGVEHAPAPPDL